MSNKFSKPYPKASLNRSSKIYTCLKKIVWDQKRWRRIGKKWLTGKKTEEIFFSEDIQEE